MDRSLRVAVFSHHELIRAGLTQLIELDPGRAVVTGTHATVGPPGCCDVAVYELDGSPTTDDGLRQLIDSGTAVVALAREPGIESSEEVLAMGVAEVVSIDVTPATLRESLEHAAAGRRVAPAVVRAEAREAARSALGLTEREIAVLELIAAGLSNDQIADELYVSINTVKTYVRTAYRRIGAESRPHAVIWAMRHGLGPQTARLTTVA